MAAMRTPIVGVMGPGAPSDEVREIARELGSALAAAGFIVLSGGRASGVMEAVSKGAKSEGGLVIGVLPDDDATQASAYVDIPIVTGMGSARNNINVLSSDVVIACGMGPGTASEVALAMKAGKPIILLAVGEDNEHFFSKLGRVLIARDVHEALRIAMTRLSTQ